MRGELLDGRAMGGFKELKLLLMGRMMMESGSGGRVPSLDGRGMDAQRNGLGKDERMPENDGRMCTGVEVKK